MIFKSTIAAVALIAASCAPCGFVGCALADVQDGNLEETSQQLSFTIDVQDQRIGLPRFFASILPGSVLSVSVNAPPTDQIFTFKLTGEENDTAIKGPRTFSWKAPNTPGTAMLSITDEASGDTMELVIFIQTPFDAASQTTLDGYRIGSYPDKPLRGLSIYLPPAGFIAVTDANKTLKVSPNFSLGEFICKQQTTSEVKYIVLRPELVHKLEQIRAQLVLKGVSSPRITVMSGYRTPYYNKLIGNVPYSRHVWGGAADIFIDNNPRDGRMDDLNKNGQFDKQDAAWLLSAIEDLELTNPGQVRRGGLGEYGPKSHRGAFVHVDVRGTPARWGR